MSATKTVMRNMSMAQVNSYVVNAEKLLNLREVFATTAMAHNFDAESPLSKKIEVTRDRADVVFWGPQEEARNSGGWWRSWWTLWRWRLSLVPIDF